MKRCSYELDVEKTTSTRYGEKRTMASLLDWGQMDGLVVTTNVPTMGGTMHMVETRQLLHGGREHLQV